MTNRIVLSLDITSEEAQAIAGKIGELGPDYKAWHIEDAIERISAMDAPAGKVRRISLRSNASAKLGGPDGS